MTSATPLLKALSPSLYIHLFLLFFFSLKSPHLAKPRTPPHRPSPPPRPPRVPARPRGRAGAGRGRHRDRAPLGGGAGARRAGGKWRSLPAPCPADPRPCSPRSPSIPPIAGQEDGVRSRGLGRAEGADGGEGAGGDPEEMMGHGWGGLWLCLQGGRLLRAGGLVRVFLLVCTRCGFPGVVSV